MVNTFVPETDFEQIARLLDRPRLGAQCREGKQIYFALLNGGGYEGHPATRMWRGHEQGLAAYVQVMCAEWLDRGYVDAWSMALPKGDPDDLPSWWGRDDVHNSHRAVLWYKDPHHYHRYRRYAREFFDYVWPR